MDSQWGSRYDTYANAAINHDGEPLFANKFDKAMWTDGAKRMEKDLGTKLRLPRDEEDMKSIFA